MTEYPLSAKERDFSAWLFTVKDWLCWFEVSIDLMEHHTEACVAFNEGVKAKDFAIKLLNEKGS